MTEWGIDTLFNPGKRHMDEEKRRLQSTREEIGDASGGRRIDLESGTVKISRKPKVDQPAEADASNGPAASDDPAAAAAEGSRGTTDVNSADTQVMPTQPD